MEKLTLKSRVKDLYANPVGRDALDKILLQIGKSNRILTNPVVRNIKLSTLQKLTKSKIGEDFFSSLLELLNTEQDTPSAYRGEISRKWWKSAVFYQIYPRSFKDSNEDGIGDLGGIIEKLDYLKELGIDALWLSPIYDSPNDDNGYDIRDYQKIMAEFGTMEDFERLLSGLHERGMKLIMDLVVNHTSDEHRWFQEALNNPMSKYRDYYFFRESEEDTPPNNWTSFFSGPAWNYYAEQKIWAMHLFSKKQMDLNWENKNLREEIYSMVRWWLEKGVDGFRLDVINYISKPHDLKDGNETIGELMEFRGVEKYFYGPHLHDYLGELKEKAFAPYQAFSVGETPGIGMECAKLLTAESRKELDMIFSFDHLETPGHVRFDDYAYDLNYLKNYLMDWSKGYPNDCWMSLFYDNHDNPRFVSKVSEDERYRTRIAKLLAGIQLTLRGTPFIFQGQEIGMVNQKFESIEQMNDVESLNLYHELLENGKTDDEAFAHVLAGSRDHARTPMQWSTEDYAGFSNVPPWIFGDEDYKECNVSNQIGDEHSVYSAYKQLIALRKSEDALVYGEIEFLNPKRKNVWAYLRKDEKSCFLVECNLSDSFEKRGKFDGKVEVLFSNVESRGAKMQPYEVCISRIVERR